MRELITALFATLLCHAAFAHDHDRPELNAWFDNLSSGKGLCCSHADGTSLSDVDWKFANKHYQVWIEGQWVDVPDEAVIKEPNRDGATMVWPIYHRALGVPVRIEIRCFMPGALF